ncbi:unnamed protein product [Dibothriocephalus latus]|uniref:Tyrosine-protein phosphatase domain-containing protein n=1 Tax=Dibothriocephalus latus TaxID=60516 RepID=A0A3P6T0V2_DIBLA|nr:unnamed protein product [Dibothriocephalus latus]
MLPVYLTETYAIHNKLTNKRIYPIKEVDGSGRTGTFICINELLDIIRQDVIGATVPVAQFALRLAAARPQMISCVEQYAFIYAVISEWVRSGGKTAVPVAMLPVAIEELKKPPKSGFGIGCCSSKYEAEFTQTTMILTKQNCKRIAAIPLEIYDGLDTKSSSKQLIQDSGPEK